MAAVSEHADVALVREAIRKIRIGEKPTGREAAALRRHEQLEREKVYQAVPRPELARLFGRKTTSLNTWFRNHGLPTVGERADLGALLPAMATLVESARREAEDAKRQIPNDMVRSQVELASALGVSDRLIRNYIVRPDWPFGQTAPWPLEAVKRWREITFAPTDGDEVRDDDEVGLRKRLLLAQIARAERENERLAGELIDRQDARSEIRSYVANLRGAIAAAARALPKTLEARGLLRDGGRAEATRISESVFRKMCESFARSMRRVADP